MHTRHRIFAVFLLATLLLGCARTELPAASPDPAIPIKEYTEERANEILKQFNSMRGKKELCGNAFINTYQKALHDHCIATDGGKNIGGGCAHVAYAWSIHTHVLELGIEHCTRKPQAE